ncbi:hypothetical protein EX30DRAFT_342958 [Ascodesmis nigricans]|uniref:Uncharacterized protein n=1 Tax=Ascodesmis nigricans TaxID=341454 RepID=A0A4S2MSG6_9PEZI|nr:hypothetical protein EX30DRAFT_342958 [Ascodesmis nigricans]
MLLVFLTFVAAVETIRKRLGMPEKIHACKRTKGSRLEGKKTQVTEQDRRRRPPPLSENLVDQVRGIPVYTRREPGE